MKLKVKMWFYWKRHGNMQTISPLQRLLTFFRDVFLSIHKPFVFDVDYLNLLLPVKVGLCKHLWYKKEKTASYYKAQQKPGRFHKLYKVPPCSWGCSWWQTQRKCSERETQSYWSSSDSLEPFRAPPELLQAPSTAAVCPKLAQGWPQSKLQMSHQDHWAQEEISSEQIYLHDFQGGKTMVSIPSKYSVKKVIP